MFAATEVTSVVQPTVAETAVATAEVISGQEINLSTGVEPVLGEYKNDVNVYAFVYLPTQ